jgi:hypothetical protein
MSMLKCIYTSLTVCLCWCIELTTLPPSYADSLEILGASTSWSPKGLSRLVMEQIYLAICLYLNPIQVLFTKKE